jgi:hypothetical protein
VLIQCISNPRIVELGATLREYEDQRLDIESITIENDNPLIIVIKLSIVDEGRPTSDQISILDRTRIT